MENRNNNKIYQSLLLVVVVVAVVVFVGEFGISEAKNIVHTYTTLSFLDATRIIPKL